MTAPNSQVDKDPAVFVSVEMAIKFHRDFHKWIAIFFYQS